MTNEWPKKLTAAKYARRWHVDRTKESIINDLEAVATTKEATP